MPRTFDLNSAATMIPFVLAVTLVGLGRPLMKGFRTSCNYPSCGTVSVWLSGWFKLTERIHRGQVAVGGPVLLIFAISWMALAAVKNEASFGAVPAHSLIGTTIGFGTAIVRCTPALNRRNPIVNRIAIISHALTGVLVLAL